MQLSFGRSNTISFFSSFKTECMRFTLSTSFSSRYVKLIMLLNNFRHVSPSTLLLIAVFLEGSSSTTHDSVDPTSFSVILFRLVLSPLCLDFLFRFWFQSFHPKLKMAIFDTVLIKNSNPIFFLFFFWKLQKNVCMDMTTFSSLDKSNRAFFHHHQNQDSIFAFHHFCNSIQKISQHLLSLFLYYPYFLQDIYLRGNA